MTLGNDLETKEFREQVILIVTTVSATIINATIYGNVAVMLTKVSDGVSPILREKIDTMLEYMNFMKFSAGFINQIEEYHLNIWFKQRNMLYEESFFGDMSRALQKIVLINQWKHTFFVFSKFLPIVSESFMLDIVINLEPKIYMTNDIIITEGEFNSEVYFVSSNGFCKVYIGGQWIRDLRKGDYFGEIATFLRSRRRTATILSYKDADYLFIDGQKFERLLRNYPDDYEKLKTVAVQTLIDSMKFYPSSLFAKLVPNNNVKDYLLRKCIYLNEEEEDKFYNVNKGQLMDGKEYTDKINYIMHHLNEIKNKLEIIE
jgi:CRP-like cAMP-binding protein